MKRLAVVQSVENNSVATGMVNDWWIYLGKQENVKIETGVMST